MIRFKTIYKLKHFTINSSFAIIMRLLIGATFLALAVAVSIGEITFEDNPVYDYHRRFGIHEARRIHNFEATKIVGGYVTDVSETPYQVRLLASYLFWLFVYYSLLAMFCLLFIIVL